MYIIESYPRAAAFDKGKTAVVLKSHRCQSITDIEVNDMNRIFLLRPLLPQAINVFYIIINKLIRRFFALNGLTVSVFPRGDS